MERHAKVLSIVSHGLDRDPDGVVNTEEEDGKEEQGGGEEVEGEDSSEEEECKKSGLWCIEEQWRLTSWRLFSS